MVLLTERNLKRTFAFTKKKKKKRAKTAFSICFATAVIDAAPPSPSWLCSARARPVNPRGKVLKEGMRLYSECQLPKKMAD